MCRDDASAAAVSYHGNHTLAGLHGEMCFHQTIVTMFQYVYIQCHVVEIWGVGDLFLGQCGVGEGASVRRGEGSGQGGEG